MSALPPLSSTDGWMNTILTFVVVVLALVAFGAYPIAKWYAKRQRDSKGKQQ